MTHSVTTLFTCDRCGTELPISASAPVEDVSTIAQEDWHDVGFIDKTYKDGETAHDIELCETCGAALKNYLTSFLVWKFTGVAAPAGAPSSP